MRIWFDIEAIEYPNSEKIECVARVYDLEDVDAAGKVNPPFMISKWSQPVPHPNNQGKYGPIQLNEVMRGISHGFIHDMGERHVAFMREATREANRRSL